MNQLACNSDQHFGLDDSGELKKFVPLALQKQANSFTELSARRRRLCVCLSEEVDDVVLEATRVSLCVCVCVREATREKAATCTESKPAIARFVRVHLFAPANIGD